MCSLIILSVFHISYFIPTAGAYARRGLVLRNERDLWRIEWCFCELGLGAFHNAGIFWVPYHACSTQSRQNIFARVNISISICPAAGSVVGLRWVSAEILGIARYI